MRKIIGLLLAIIVVTAANSQTEISVEACSKELRFEKDVVKLVAIKTITYKAIVPKSDSGWVKESVNGQKWQDTFVIGQQAFSKTEATYPIKNLNNKEFVKANCSPSSFDYDKAYKSPGKKVLYWYGGDKESTTYSNYFLKKTITHTNFWVMYHPNAKNPYFEVDVDNKPETSVPWIRLLTMFILISIFGKLLADSFFDDDIVFNKLKNFKRAVFVVIVMFVVNTIVGLPFLFIFEGISSVMFSERIVAWFVRLFLLSALTFIWYKRLVAENKKDNEIVDDHGESLIDTITGSE